MNKARNHGTNEVNSYYQNFMIAQLNLNKLIQEERLLRKLNKRGRQNTSTLNRADDGLY